MRLCIRIRRYTGQLHLGVRAFNSTPRHCFTPFCLNFNALANCVPVLHLRSVFFSLNIPLSLYVILLYPCISDWNVIFFYLRTPFYGILLGCKTRLCICRPRKGKSVPLQAWSGPEGSRKLRFPDFMTTAQDGGKVVSLMHRPPLPPGNVPGTHFC